MRKDICIIGAWNVRALWAAGKLELLKNEMKRNKYDLSASQKCVGHEKDKHQTVASSAGEKAIQTPTVLRCCSVKKPKNYFCAKMQSIHR
jgi:hypothetical protein